MAQGQILHSLQTGNDLHYAKLATFSSGPPITAPEYEGQTYVQKDNNILYIAFGTTSVSDWKPQISQPIVLVVNSSGGMIPSSLTRIYVEVNTSLIPIILTMPPHQEGSIVTIIDFKLNSYNNKIILNLNSGIGTIDNSATSYIIDSNGASVSFISQQSISNWAIIS